MDVIKRWIDESDVFLLILGGRYGSIDPVSGKSYIQLEYEYAQEQAKPFFAVVIKEDSLKKRVKSRGIDVYETTYPQQLKDFRAKVLTKMVTFWGDPKDIELAVQRTLANFARRDDLVGWIPGNQAVVTEEMARLTKVNDALREQIFKLRAAYPAFSGLTFDEMFQLLLRKRIDPTQVFTGDAGNPKKRSENIRSTELFTRSSGRKSNCCRRRSSAIHSAERCSKPLSDQPGISAKWIGAIPSPSKARAASCLRYSLTSQAQ
jgi:Domain of unknown function (DUF4062)